MTKFIFMGFWILWSLLLCNPAPIQGQESHDYSFVYESLEEAMIDPKAVYRLKLRRKKLDLFPFEICKLTNLRELDLSKNKLTEIPKEIYQLKELHKLDLSNNNLVYLPPEIGQLKKLDTLIIFRLRFSCTLQ